MATPLRPKHAISKLLSEGFQNKFTRPVPRLGHLRVDLHFGEDTRAGTKTAWGLVVDQESCSQTLSPKPSGKISSPLGQSPL